MSSQEIRLSEIVILEEELAEICRRFHVRELALFGSVLRDGFREDSDIDVLVEYELGARVTLFDHFDLQRELQRLLGRDVDLISKRGLRPALRESIAEPRRVIYAT